MHYMHYKQDVQGFLLFYIRPENDKYVHGW